MFAREKKEREAPASLLNTASKSAQGLQERSGRPVVGIEVGWSRAAERCYGLGERA